MNIDGILYKDLTPLLTDLVNAPGVFHNTFKYSESIGHPIKTVLELGVFTSPSGQPANIIHGQSTKILLALCDFYKVEKMISLDINNCLKTVEAARKWLEMRGSSFNNYIFIQSNSLEFDISSHFPNGIDLIFLDTNHDDNYPQRIGISGDTGGAGFTYREICYYAPHLTKHGHMFLHDTKVSYVPQQYGHNTAGAVERFIDEHKHQFQFKEHNINKYGLGEITRIN